MGEGGHAEIQPGIGVADIGTGPSAPVSHGSRLAVEVSSRQLIKGEILQKVQGFHPGSGVEAGPGEVRVVERTAVGTHPRTELFNRIPIEGVCQAGCLPTVPSNQLLGRLSKGIPRDDALRGIVQSRLAEVLAVVQQSGGIHHEGDAVDLIILLVVDLSGRNEFTRSH